MKKRRGKLLTIYFVLMILSYLESLRFIRESPEQIKVFGSYQSWGVIYLYTLNIFTLIALTGIWFWKKWGVYLNIALMIVATISAVFDQDILTTFLVVLFVWIQLWPIYRKWEYFE